MVGWFAALAVLLVATLAHAAALAAETRSSPRASRSSEVEAGKREHLDDSWPRELAAVTSNLNALLAGERTRIRRYRDTLGNLAHSLKTPLAGHAAVARHGQCRSRPQGRSTPRSTA